MPPGRCRVHPVKPDSQSRAHGDRESERLNDDRDQRPTWLILLVLERTFPIAGIARSALSSRAVDSHIGSPTNRVRLVAPRT